MFGDDPDDLAIIPLREKTGNYDLEYSLGLGFPIIPLREKTGNYDLTSTVPAARLIIPLREKTGNYDFPAKKCGT